MIGRLLGRVGCVLLLIVGVVVLLGLGLAGLAIDRFLASPDGVVVDHVSAIRNDRFDEAYDELCGSLKAELSRPDFERQTRERLAELGSIQRTEHVATIPRLEHVSVYWRYDGLRSNRQVEYQVVRELLGFRVCGIEWPE